MKRLRPAATFAWLALALGCHRNTDPPVQPVPDSNLVAVGKNIDQNRTAFTSAQINCLDNQTRSGTAFKNDTLVFKAINSADEYTRFFQCQAALPPIDFTRFTLLIVMPGPLPSPNMVNNISRINQYVDDANPDRTIFTVEMTGKRGGGEWFMASGLYPKIRDASTVRLAMRYTYQ